MRLLILSDVNHTAPLGLIRATLRLAAARPGWEACGIVTTRPEAFHPGAVATVRQGLRRALVVATPGTRTAFGRGMPIGPEIRHAAARHGVPFLVPDGGDPNHPAFVERVAGELRPDLTLSVFCLHVLRRPLLDALGPAVNYHDGLLPAHRGLNATPFSLYAGDRRSGFAFHWMEEAVDAGRILADGAVPVAPGDALSLVTRRKVAAAVSALPAVLDRAAAGDPGRPQEGGGAYHSGDDGRDMRRVEDPGRLTAAELARRVRAFGPVEIAVGGRSLPVTRLRRAPRGGRLAFRSADGVLLRPDRLMGVPPRVHTVVNRVTRRFSRGDV